MKEDNNDNKIKFLKPKTWDYNLAVASAPEAIRSTYGAFNYDVDPTEIATSGGYSMGNYGGVGFQRINNIDEAGLRKQLRSDNASSIMKNIGAFAAAGSAAGPLGTVFGGITGGIVGGIGAAVKSNSMDEKILQARNSNFRTNTINQVMSQSQAMKYDWNKSFVDTYNQIRHGDKGLDINAYVQRNETVVDDEGNGKRINVGTPGVDNVGLRLLPNQGVITNKFGLSEEANMYADIQNYVKDEMYKISAKANKNFNNKQNLKIATNVIKGSKDFKDLIALNEYSKEGIRNVENKQKFLREINVLEQGDNDMSRNGVNYAAAGLDNLVVNGLSGLVGLGQFIGAQGQNVKSPNTYIRNPYITQAFDALDRINIPLYPLLNQLREDKARGYQQITSSGGLGTAQKAAAYATLASNNQSNTAKAMFNYYNQLNDIKSKTAQLKLGEGQHAAQMMQNAAQWDLDYYSKAHAARQDMMNMGIVNTIGSLRQIVADADKRRRWEQLMGQYSQERGSNARSEVYNNPLNTKKSETGSLASIKNANPNNKSVEQLLDYTKQKNTIPYTVPKMQTNINIPTIPIGSNQYYIDKAKQAADRLYSRLFR